MVLKSVILLNTKIRKVECRSKRSMIMPRRSIFDEVKDRKHIGLFRLSDGFYLRFIERFARFFGLKPFQRAHRSRIITEKRAAETGSPFLQNDFTYTDLFVIRIFDAEETQSVARRININRSCSADLYLEFAGRRCVRRRAADLGEGFAVDGNAYQAGRIFGRTGIRCHNRQLTRGGSRKVARPVAVGLAVAAPLDEFFWILR